MNTMRTVWLTVEEPDSDTLTVEATLRVLQHAAWGKKMAGLDRD